MWANGSQPCVRLQAQIRIGILYPTQGGGEVKCEDPGHKGRPVRLRLRQKRGEGHRVA